MHLGAFDDEPATVEIMDAYLEQNGYANDMTGERLHHEIYLSDARKVAPEKWKTVIRHPIKKQEEQTMELKDALLRRRSVRKFTKDTISDQMIEEILHAAMSGPSACNKMPWEFYVVTNKEMLSALKSATKFTNLDAPLAIIVCGNLSRALPMQLSEYWIQDCSAATENILLRVTDLSLGAVWCGIHPQKRAVEKVQKLLEMPAKHIPLNVIFIGHPAEFPEARDQYNPKRVHFVKDNL